MKRPVTGDDDNNDDDDDDDNNDDDDDDDDNNDDDDDDDDNNNKNNTNQISCNIYIYIYHKKKETANADYVNNMKRQHITMYQHAPYVLAKNNTYTHDTACATICKEIRVKFDKEHR